MIDSLGDPIKRMHDAAFRLSMMAEDLFLQNCTTCTHKQNTISQTSSESQNLIPLLQ